MQYIILAVVASVTVAVVAVRLCFHRKTTVSTPVLEALNAARQSRLPRAERLPNTIAIVQLRSSCSDLQHGRCIVTRGQSRLAGL